MANFSFFNQFNKGNKSSSTDVIVTKLNVHSIMTIHNCFKFHKIPLTGCLVMTQFVDIKAIQGQLSMHY